MKILKNTFAIIALATLASSAMAADEKVVTEEGVATFSFFKPAAVRAEVSTLGYGGAVSYSVTPTVGLTLGYAGGDVSWSDDISLHGVDYDLEADNNNIYLNAEIRPFSNAFYTALGVGYIDAKYNVNKIVQDGNSVKIDGTKYSNVSGQTGKFTGDVNYKNTIAPYVGFGFSPAITTRFGLFGEVGAYYTGNPDASFTAENLETGSKEAAENEENKFNTGSKYKWLPVAKVGVSFRF